MEKQVKKEVYNELIVTKSKFITFLFPVSSIDEIKEKLKYFKEKYKDATHVCYAYILDCNTFKYYDDGEPSSTAGAPIYQVLKNNDIVYSMCVVIRYFGGTKLGVGGLIKAYTNSCLECLNKAEIIAYEKKEIVTIALNYNVYDQIEYFLKINDIWIINKKFSEQVILTIETSSDKLTLLQEQYGSLIKSITKETC